MSFTCSLCISSSSLLNQISETKRNTFQGGMWANIMYIYETTQTDKSRVGTLKGFLDSGVILRQNFENFYFDEIIYLIYLWLFLRTHVLMSSTITNGVLLCLPFHFRKHSLRLVRQSWLTSRISQSVFLSNWIELYVSIPKLLCLLFHLPFSGRDKRRRWKINLFTDGCFPSQKGISLMPLRNCIIILWTLDINIALREYQEPFISLFSSLLGNNNKVT